jgi:deoxycytidylate deaminase
MDFDWADLAFGSKKPLKDLNAAFIVAPRTMSNARLAQLIKEFLPHGPVVLGIAKEPYVAGFEDQPQFRMLDTATAAVFTKKVAAAKTPHKLYTLRYFQRELGYILDKVPFRRVVLVNGSWKQVFHSLEPYHILSRKHTPYDMVSPFADEDEAKAFDIDTWPAIQATMPQPDPAKTYTDKEMLDLAEAFARQSYDYSHQTGLTLGKKVGRGYRFLASTFNAVLPFQTYAMHYGNSREQHFSPAHDLNHYDTVHAEVELLLAAIRDKIELTDTTVFITLLPCPPCSRMLAQTPIREVVYRLDHSDAYAVKLLETAGKTVRRVI